MRYGKTAEEIAKDFGGKLTYYRHFTTAEFNSQSSAMDFCDWLSHNDYVGIRKLASVDFSKVSIHAHRLLDAKKYPQLKLIQGDKS